MDAQEERYLAKRWARDDPTELTLELSTCHNVTRASNDMLHEVPAYGAHPLVHSATERDVAGSRCRTRGVRKGPEDLPMQESKAEGSVEGLVVSTLGCLGTSVGLPPG